MAGFAIGPRRGGGGGGRAPVFRWECRCRDVPFLLATYDADGRINIKVGDRYWHVDGQVRTTCPRCGAEHVLDLRDVDPANLHAHPSRPPAGPPKREPRPLR